MRKLNSFCNNGHFYVKQHVNNRKSVKNEETVRQTDRQTDRDRERQRQRETDRERDRDGERDTERDGDRERQRETETERGRERMNKLYFTRVVEKTRGLFYIQPSPMRELNYY